MTREMYMRRALCVHFPALAFVFDKIINDGCSRRRPDVFIECLTHCIVIECDEHQHKRYICENRRTMEIFNDLGGRPVVFIRFNPDAYTMNGRRIRGSFREDRSETGEVVLHPRAQWKARTSQLFSRVQLYIDTVPSKDVTEVQLFYDK